MLNLLQKKIHYFNKYKFFLVLMGASADKNGTVVSGTLVLSNGSDCTTLSNCTVNLTVVALAQFTFDPYNQALTLALNEGFFEMINLLMRS